MSFKVLWLYSGWTDTDSRKEKKKVPGQTCYLHDCYWVFLPPKTSCIPDSTLVFRSFSESVKFNTLLSSSAGCDFGDSADSKHISKIISQCNILMFSAVIWSLNSQSFTHQFLQFLSNSHCLSHCSGCHLDETLEKKRKEDYILRVMTGFWCRRKTTETKKTNSETGFLTTCDVWINDGSRILGGITVLSYSERGCRMKWNITYSSLRPW